MRPNIEIVKDEVLSDNWYVLRKVTYRIQQPDGSWDTQAREAYDRGNGAVVLPYDLKRRTVLLTRQLRIPTLLNGNPSGMLVEACAGLLDGDHPEEGAKRELLEETGYELQHVEKVFEAYMSPGSVTEILYFFVGEYSPDHRVSEGGGVDDEDIEIIELPFDEAMRQVASNEIRDAKTIMLLQHAALHIFR